MRRGGSLVEVILAVSLVGLVILFLLGLLPSTKLLANEAEQQMEATRYAEELLAHMTSRSFEEAKLHSGEILVPSNPGFLAEVLSERRAVGAVTLRPSIRIEPLPGSDRVLQIAVSIEWESRRRSKSFRLVRRISSVLR